MGIYRMKIAGRKKPLLVKADSLTAAKDRIVEGGKLTAEEVETALDEGEKVWKDGQPFPSEEVEEEVVEDKVEDPAPSKGAAIVKDAE